MRCHPTVSAPSTTLTFFSAGETEAQGKESNFSKNAEQSNVKCPSLEVGKAWDSCFMSLP